MRIPLIQSRKPDNDAKLAAARRDAEVMIRRVGRLDDASSEQVADALLSVHRNTRIQRHGFRDEADTENAPAARYLREADGRSWILFNPYQPREVVRKDLLAESVTAIQYKHLLNYNEGLPDTWQKAEVVLGELYRPEDIKPAELTRVRKWTRRKKVLPHRRNQAERTQVEIERLENAGNQAIKRIRDKSAHIGGLSNAELDTLDLRVRMETQKHELLLDKQKSLGLDPHSRIAAAAAEDQLIFIKEQLDAERAKRQAQGSYPRYQSLSDLKESPALPVVAAVPLVASAGVLARGLYTRFIARPEKLRKAYLALISKPSLNAVERKVLQNLEWAMNARSVSTELPNS
ncbi:MAG: hypothetical protein AB7P76_13310 [Candidatus Melainabacteria bacterium]